MDLVMGHIYIDKKTGRKATLTRVAGRSATMEYEDGLILKLTIKAGKSLSDVLTKEYKYFGYEE